MSRYHDDSSSASNPGRLRLSRSRLQRLEPEAPNLPERFDDRYDSWEDFEEMLAEHLRLGDVRVVSVHPLEIAAYTDELDCVALLRFPIGVAEEHRLSLGDRLLTVNTYQSGPRTANDLVRGPRGTKQYANFYPVIAEFVSDDQNRLAKLRASILDKEWKRCLRMGREYQRQFPGRHRLGTPLWSGEPAWKALGLAWWMYGLLGAGILLTLVLVKVLLRLPRLAQAPDVATGLPLLLLGVGTFGFVAGCLVWCGRPLSRRIGVFGDVLIGMAILVLGFLCCIACFSWDECQQWTATSWLALLGLAAAIGGVGGLLVGQSARNAAAEAAGEEE